MKKPATGQPVRAFSFVNIKESLAHSGSVGASKIGKKENGRLVPDWDANRSCAVGVHLVHLSKPTPAENLTGSFVVVKLKEIATARAGAELREDTPGARTESICRSGRLLRSSSTMPVIPPRSIVSDDRTV